MNKRYRNQYKQWIETGMKIGILLLVILFFIYIIYAHLYGFEKYCFEVITWDTIASISTLIAAVLAYKAYQNSIKMRKQSSFDTVFAQILANFRSYLLDQRVITTERYVNILVENEGVEHKKVSEPLQISSFVAFCQLYEEKTKVNGKFQSQRAEDIFDIWGDYSKSLVYRANFFNAFKYIYYLVDLVIKSPLDENTKKQYVQIVQAQLNMDILFCYLINLICMSRGEANSYIYTLRKYDFFKDIFDDGERYKIIIESTIPTNIRNSYYKHK